MTIAAVVQMLQDFPAELEAEYLASSPDSPADLLVYLLLSVRDFQAEVTAFKKQVEQNLISSAGTKRWVVEGVGEVEIKKSTYRNHWDHEALTKLLVAMAADERQLNEDTGEYEKESDAVARVLMECALPSWRTTPLRARHIQVDEFCEERDDGWSVRLPSKKKTVNKGTHDE